MCLTLKTTSKFQSGLCEPYFTTTQTWNKHRERFGGKNESETEACIFAIIWDLQLFIF